MRIFSGIRPTGDLHIGNYLGSIKQWISLQDKNECVFSVVDLHAITTPYDPVVLQDKIKETVITYLASGIDPEKCILFVQSSVKEHLELFWFLNTITPVAELKRMTQFKDKSAQHKEYINAGLLNYPVLMASDILLYNTEIVPVGIDQKQHVEITRTIAKKFNKRFGKTFIIPKVSLSEGAKIMSLSNPDKKMSKTGDQKGCLTLFEESKEIEKKIMSAVTDSENKVSFNLRKKKGISNLLVIYSLFSGKTIKESEKEFKEKTYSEFKKKVAEKVISEISCFRRKREELISRKGYLEQILNNGTQRAQIIAQEKMKEVRKTMGF